MAGQFPPSPENGNRFDSLMNLMPDQIRRPFAIAGSVAVLGGGLATARALGSSPAIAQEAVSTETSSNPADSPNACQVPSDQSQLYDGCRDSSMDTNLDVAYCQDQATNRAQNTIDMIASRKLKFKVGRKHIEAEEGLRRMELWAGKEFIYACPEVTRNYVKLQLVKNIGKSKDPRASDTRVIGKATIVRGDDSTEFNGVFSRIVKRKKILSLPRKLTTKDLRDHKFGVKDVIVSEPLIQVPYSDPMNPDRDIPGPMVTVESKPHITWIS
jgi:hypothetical protein